MDRVAAMTAFVAVAEARGFAAGARRLGMSPVAATRAVAHLEAHLGVRLLARTTRSVSLTDSGADYLARARQILAAVADAEGVARAARTTPSGRLAIAAPTVFGRLHVAPLVSTLVARYPEIRPELVLADRVANLVDEGLDVAVRIGELADSSLRVRAVGSTRRMLVASPRYLAAHGAPRAPADLARHSLVHVTALSPRPEWHLQRAGRACRVAIAPRLVTNSVEAALAFAERDGGITPALAYQVADAVRARRLTVVLPRFEPPPLPIQVVYPSAHHPTAALRAFVDLAAASRTWTFLHE